MSTRRKGEQGGKTAVDAAVRETQALVDQACSDEQEQLDLLAEPITAEEMAVAREKLGPKAGHLTVLREAREARKKGRTPGSRNRRTDDFVRYASQFGPDPAVALMQIIGSPEEVMIARSQSIDPAKRRMTYGEARALRIRAAETMMPYFHGKQPVRVDATIRGVHIHEQIGRIDRGAAPIDGEIIGVMPFDDKRVSG